MRYAYSWSFRHAGDADCVNLSRDVLGSVKRLHPILYVGQTHLRAHANEICHPDMFRR
jgi:hypothetical protein